MAPTLAELQHLYPALGALRGQLEALALQPVTAPAGTVLFSENDPCKGFPLLLEGEVRVSRSSPDGRSLELYRLVPGDMCLASSACLFRSQPLSARAVTTRPTRLLLIPPPTFRRWLAEPAFRDFVLGLYAERMADLTALVDEVAFHKLDRRLAAALLGHGPELAITHQELANVLGTVREMVTRLLRRFEREGWIELARERIRIRDGAALRRLAEAA
ncbi:Crp/Fnr family transcriptional regulator [Ramlibacter alkalitolerans]|uniref:Crp/Fnr family transcriptional regulator n=1 Tax=Ramlibacter alkalitolerans TaxID=2039631 RepID=A0ABS1JRH7_9BURK|nr:Crp/Fnr family transcriptional regulator [Ramlibacter alkalitolerans]MBL0426852.1 Crp/Fnr family transcriptional regulator [Ramlibacter alkalitolerans]